ncbi:HEAT repeat domain-containing protein [Athalassotoga saccharophila]|uniref:HEAT repeat domain-containing protein n=1 Tax=Athalassotoga saccharophila TaxID=1441386 RepID=UPI00137949F0|nr:HEAT repeat domain-containing protein [Athalassotoga saccharophila]BBJ27787.1 peptidase C14 caspase catalytic subunit p20 [Athalassotoga saccharophila]
MKSTKQIFLNIKEKLLQDRIKNISLDLNSTNAITVAVAFNELRRLKDRWHTQDAIKVLSHPEEFLVISAIKYLAAISYPLESKDVEPLLKRGERIKKEAINLFPHMAMQDGCKMLSLTLEDSSPNVRIKSLKTLEKIGCKEAIKKAKKLTEDPDVLVKIEAIRSCAVNGEEVDPKIIVDVIEDTKLPFNVRSSAMKVFATYFQGSLPLIKKLSKSTYSKISSTAILLMGRFSCDEVWESLKEIINDSAPVENVEAAIKSVSICKDKKELEEMILKYIDYPSKSLKITTLKTLINLESQRVEGIIEEILEGNDKNLKISVIPFVERFPSKANVESLLEIIEGEDEELTEKSLKVLAKLKIKDERIKNLLDGPKRIKIQALKSLIASKDIDSDELIDIFKNSDSIEMKMEALNGMAKLFPQRLEELS